MGAWTIGLSLMVERTRWLLRQLRVTEKLRSLALLKDGTYECMEVDTKAEDNCLVYCSARL